MVSPEHTESTVELIVPTVAIVFSIIVKEATSLLQPAPEVTTTSMRSPPSIVML